MARKEENIWNRFSSIYDFVMKKDKAAYENIIEQTALLINPNDNVLEIATGTGAIAIGLSNFITHIEAIDFSNDMIAIAKKKASKLKVFNIRFTVQDACNLQYSSNSFDYIIISNALHIMPEPRKVLEEIIRVLKQDGRLIAPTFVHKESKKAAILSKLMSVTGFRAYHKWTERSYNDFLEQNGFEVIDTKMFKASFPLAYIVAKKINI